MFRIFSKTLVLLSLLALACTGPNHLNDPQPQHTDDDTNGTVTEVGTPLGAAVSQTIGAEGGQLSTPDGRVSLRIPAGAVTSPTTFSVQPIENQAPNGVGMAYRFSPDGAQFKQPLTLTYTYTDDDTRGSLPGALHVGYQKSDGVWYSVPGLKVDEAKKQVSVPMTHFSDWALLDAFALVTSGDYDDIPYFGESVNLTVLEIPAIDEGQETALRLQEFGKERIGKWSVAGGGTINPTGDGSATYTAPLAPTAQNPVTVSVELTFPKSSVKVILVQQLVVGLGYIKVKFEGKNYYLTAVHLDDEDGTIHVGGGIPTGAFTSDISADRPGQYRFSAPEKEANVSALSWGFNAGKSYDSGHANCSGTDVHSLGYVILTKYKKGRYAKGTFFGNVIDNDGDLCDHDGPGISGEFHVRPTP